MVCLLVPAPMHQILNLIVPKVKSYEMIRKACILAGFRQSKEVIR